MMCLLSDLHSTMLNHTGVCERNIPPKENPFGEISSKNTISGAREQFLLQGSMTKARKKGVLFHRHRYDMGSRDVFVCLSRPCCRLQSSGVSCHTLLSM